MIVIIVIMIIIIIIIVISITTTTYISSSSSSSIIIIIIITIIISYRSNSLIDYAGAKASAGPWGLLRGNVIMSILMTTARIATQR